MRKQRIRQFGYTLAAAALIAQGMLLPLKAFAATFTIYESGPTLATDHAILATDEEWRLESIITPTSNTSGIPANASLVFA